MKGLLSEKTGQSTVEFAVLTIAFLVVCTTLFALFSASHDGSLSENHIAAASHTSAGSVVQGIQDALMY